jgi:hypothetical protein
MSDAPFAFWITVNTITPSFKYHQALRYRSATTYGDGNPLPVIDSEMPEIEYRLGLLHAGAPLPLPTDGCSQPRWYHGELWCDLTNELGGKLPAGLAQAPISPYYP